jgi:hypothetical protein
MHEVYICCIQFIHFQSCLSCSANPLFYLPHHQILALRGLQVSLYGVIYLKAVRVAVQAQQSVLCTTSAFMDGLRI